jgi:hypothetical protein
VYTFFSFLTNSGYKALVSLVETKAFFI